jgi:hypothetical protein
VRDVDALTMQPTVIDRMASPLVGDLRSYGAWSAKLRALAARFELQYEACTPTAKRRGAGPRLKDVSQRPQPFFTDQSSFDVVYHSIDAVIMTVRDVVEGGGSIAPVKLSNTNPVENLFSGIRFGQTSWNAHPDEREYAARLSQQQTMYAQRARTDKID